MRTRYPNDLTLQIVGIACPYKKTVVHAYDLAVGAWFTLPSCSIVDVEPGISYHIMAVFINQSFQVASELAHQYARQ